MFSLLLWAGVCTSFAFAQLPTATVLGAVKDSSGAVVPGAALTARNVETGQTRTAVSAADGSYRFAALPVGNYEVRVEQSGFQAAVRSGLTLTVSQEAVVNFTLEVGAVTQTIAVTGEAPLVNTTSGSLGGLVDERKVADLPLNGRNFIDLTMLQPGIQESKELRSHSNRYGGWYSSNGAPLRSNNYLLDGAPMVGIYGGSPSTQSGNTLGLEGIREWRVVTNSFPAEYGLTMGSQMVVVTKSGTNNFHGSLFEYLRNSVLDARNFFDYKVPGVNESRLPPFKRNNFGGSIGGPIRQDKTFFHATYEGLRERLGITSILTTVGEGCRGPGGATITNAACPQLQNIPPVTITPTSALFLPTFPLPNLPNNEYTFPYSQPGREDFGQIRVDQRISDDDNLFVRYTIADGGKTHLLSYPGFRAVRSSRNQYATLSESHVFSPTLLNTFQVSFSRMFNLGDAIGLQILGPEARFMANNKFSVLQGVGQINITGFPQWGPSTFYPHEYKKNTWVYSDDLFYTQGRHALKFGALINRYHYSTLNPYFTRGWVFFPNLAGFLSGTPSAIRAASVDGETNILPHRSFKHTVLGFYVQDDFRVLPNFTLNLGLRYEFSTEFQEANGHASPLIDARNDAATTVGRKVVENNTLRNFSPRFGFAWDVLGDGRTAVRGGFALLYDLGNVNAATIQGICSPPHCSLGALGGPPATAAYRSLPLAIPPGVLGRTVMGLDYHLQQPHILHYNLAVERQLPGEMAVTLAYAGSRGINLIQVTDGNPTVPQILPDGRKFWTGTDPRINPNWNDYQMYTAGASSWYNSMQFSVLKRLTRGVQFQSSYTWSKVLDEPQDQFSGLGTPSDPSNIRLDRGPAEYDVRHNLRFNAIYRLPELVSSGGVAGSLLNGWAMSGILSLNTGLPLNPQLAANRSRSNVLSGGTVVDRPDLVPGGKIADTMQGVSRGCGTGPGSIPAGTPVGTPERWYDPCAFTLPLPGYLGNAGRNILRVPGVANLDFSLLKDFPLRFLGESGKLEFRAEFFNILNRANFYAPSNAVFGGRAPTENPQATAGRITETRATSRQIQFALKIIF
ncbi:MAG: hypothetical protein A3H28_13180 [Acidobacteria bacterium RIFCSPLOWO2_02_FULL_61_28]|nr:MAG: hypothetical protein A3H28_13180 [Acidobacteria bacterium RIFCSPLOWO2_02_FULL_61_28]